MKFYEFLQGIEFFFNDGTYIEGRLYVPWKSVRNCISASMKKERYCVVLPKNTGDPIFFPYMINKKYVTCEGQVSGYRIKDASDSTQISIVFKVHQVSHERPISQFGSMMFDTFEECEIRKDELNAQEEVTDREDNAVQSN